MSQFDVAFHFDSHDSAIARAHIKAFFASAWKTCGFSGEPLSWLDTPDFDLVAWSSLTATPSSEHWVMDGGQPLNGPFVLRFIPKKHYDHGTGLWNYVIEVSYSHIRLCQQTQSKAFLFDLMQQATLFRDR